MFQTFPESKNIILSTDIFISICYCLEKQMKSNININNINLKNSNHQYETIEYEISTSKIIQEKSILINEEKILYGHKLNGNCIEYAPLIFKFLRKLDNIREIEIFESMLPKNNYNLLKESEGKGGSLFLSTSDKKFILKTISPEELELFRNKLLIELAQYFQENNNSLLCRIYGIYKVKNTLEKEFNLLIMKNNYGIFENNVLSIFDLKGSKLNRYVNIRGLKYNDIKYLILKDNNFLETEKVLLLNNINSKKLSEIVEKDSKFLAKMNIMDYSLLVVKIELNDDELIKIFDTDFKIKNILDLQIILDEIKEGKEKVKPQLILREEYNPNNIRFLNENYENLRKFFYPCLYNNILYLISIIDYLQTYSLFKVIETQFKRIKVKNYNEISSIDAESYKDRFIDFVKKITSQKSIKERIKAIEGLDYVIL